MSCTGTIYRTLHLLFFLSVAQQPESGLGCTVLRFLDLSHTHTIGLLLIIICPHNFHMRLAPDSRCSDVKWLELEADFLMGLRLHVVIHYT
jgi:hypothetical protein